MAILNYWLVRFFLILFIISMLWGAWIVWSDGYLAKRVRAGDLRIDSIESINELPPLVSKPLRQMLILESQRETVKPGIMVKVANKYVSRKPLDSEGWLWKSLFHQRNNNIKSSKHALGIAHSLSKRNIPMLSKVFNRYLELNAVKDAMVVAGDLALAQPKRFRSVFYLMTRLHDDYDEVVAQVIPKQAPEVRFGRKSYDLSIYYNWALSDAIRAKNQKLAHAVWSATPSNLQKGSEFGRYYIEFLSQIQNPKRFRQVWFEHSGEKLVAGKLPKQRFLEGHNPCWHVVPVKGAQAFAKSFSDKGASGLMVRFSGEQNLNYAHARCTFMVEPGENYVLKGLWRGEGITTLSGPFIDIYAPSVKGFYKRNEPKIGSWPWSNFKMEFRAPNDASLLMLRLRRSATDYLDSKISGVVSFSGVELVPMSVAQLEGAVDSAVVEYDLPELAEKIQ